MGGLIKNFFARHTSNLLVTFALIAVIAALATNSKNPAQRETSAPTPSAWFEPRPTPAPLPTHFPETESISQLVPEPDDRSLETAVDTCWPGRNRRPEIGEHIDELKDVPMSFAKLEALFGKVRRREKLVSGQAEIDARHGLLFDTSIFPSGAAGSVLETDGNIKDLRLRAEGRNLACRQALDGESHLECECF